MALPPMWCPILEKPILDLKVYTKNRQFRIRGSLKGSEKKKPNPSLRHRDFFMSTRMCDRRGPPTYLTYDLGLSISHRTIRVQDCNERSTKRAKSGRKRSVSEITPTPSPVSARKHKDERWAPHRYASTPGNTPDPHPRPPRRPESSHTTCAPLDTLGAREQVQRIPSASNTSLSRTDITLAPISSPKSSCYIRHTRRYNCLISGCDKWGGKGYMDSTIIRHLNTHCKLMRENPAERTNALATAGAIGNWKCCDHFGKIQIKIRQVVNEHLCRTCHKQIPKLSTVRWKLTAYERQLIVARIQDANQTHMRILEDVPPPAPPAVGTVFDLRIGKVCVRQDR